jgi:poly-gamma-glutamate synthesis protein (capsule biosynthesis protein)
MRNRRSLAWVVACLALGGGVLVASLAGSDEPGAPAVSTTAPAGGLVTSTSPEQPASTTTRAPAPTTTTRSPLGSGEAVTIAFAGDVHFEGVVREQLDTHGERMLDAIAPALGHADLTIVNLETAITERGTPVPKAYNFRAPPRALRALAAAGVDVVSIANNHGLDYGDEGFVDTLAAEQTERLPILGIGVNAADAYAPFTTEVRGQRIAIIAATQVLDDALIADWTATADHRGLASAKDAPRLVEAVATARRSADTVVVFLHWGTERDTCPQDRQTTLAEQLVVAGADVVVGGHAHRLQGAGRLGEAFVAYGLGNFVFYTRGGVGAETGVLTVTVTGRRVDGYEWTPARLHDGVPLPLTGDEATNAVASWQALRGCTNLTE